MMYLIAYSTDNRGILAQRNEVKLFCEFDMSEGFDPKKSQIGEKALVAFIEADTISSLDSVHIIVFL